jgi:hypothetical protein
MIIKINYIQTINKSKMKIIKIEYKLIIYIFLLIILISIKT